MGDRASLPHRFRLIDLFAGAGGLTLGFSDTFDQPFQSVWANDFNVYAATTYNDNFGGHCSSGDIVTLFKERRDEIPEADIVIGGPPCQGFSLLNKNRDNDPRKQLWRPFLDIVRHSKAEIFVMENVIQLLGSPEYDAIAEEAHSMGFAIASDKLCAADYGVAQVRWRAFIVGCRFANPAPLFPPRRTHYNPNGPDTRRSRDAEPEGTRQPWRTVKDVISDLPVPLGTEIRKEPSPLDLHFGRSPTAMSQARYRAIPDQGMNRFDLQRFAPELTPDCWIRKTSGGTDLFGRLWWDRPAVTIRTEFFKPEKGRYLHPEQHRPITHREAARLQSFPDTFRFHGSKIEIARQIGNAVPPQLAAHVAASVAALLVGREVEVR